MTRLSPLRRAVPVVGGGRDGQVPQMLKKITTKPVRRFNRKAFWAKQLVLWHWVSSAICLAAILFFAVTGITLNHAASLTTTPTVQEHKRQLPPELAAAVALDEDEPDETKTPLPAEVALWLEGELGGELAGRDAEWSPEEIYVSSPRPGGDAWLAIDRQSGEVLHEVTSQGVIAYLNDLHKGRNAGAVWFWFIDVFSVACVAFSLTGLGLLWIHAKRRPSTWPLVFAGLLIPALIAVLFIH